MEFPVFAKAIQKCDTVLKPYDIFVTDILINKDKYIFDNVVNLFVGLIGFTDMNKNISSIYIAECFCII